MQITHLDHFVLTVASIEKSCQFYNDILGMEILTFAQNRTALRFGMQKINLHKHHQELEPKSHTPTPGSADFCLITNTPLSQVIKHITQHGSHIIEGPVERTGATGPLLSVYIRDPDHNLIEISNLLTTPL